MGTEQDDAARMWKYWRDKYGYVGALATYYPARAEFNGGLRQAVAQIQNAQRAIDAIMKELADTPTQDTPS